MDPELSSTWSYDAWQGFMGQGVIGAKEWWVRYDAAHNTIMHLVEISLSSEQPAHLQATSLCGLGPDTSWITRIKADGRCFKCFALEAAGRQEHV